MRFAGHHLAEILAKMLVSERAWSNCSCLQFGLAQEWITCSDKLPVLKLELASWKWTHVITCYASQYSSGCCTVQSVVATPEMLMTRDYFFINPHHVWRTTSFSLSGVEYALEHARQIAVKIAITLDEIWLCYYASFCPFMPCHKFMECSKNDTEMTTGHLISPSNVVIIN